MGKETNKIYKQYWLAEATKVDENGTVWNVVLEDGAHDSQKGVIEAQKIISGIGLDKINGRNRRYVMVTVEELPDMEVKINDDAISCCKKMVDEHYNK